MENQASSGFVFEPEIECYRNHNPKQNGQGPSPEVLAFLGIGLDAALEKERRASLMGVLGNQPSSGRQEFAKERRDSITIGFRRNSLLWFSQDEPWSAEPALPNTNSPEIENNFGPSNLNSANPARRMSVQGDDLFFGSEWNSNHIQNHAQDNSQYPSTGYVHQPLAPIMPLSQGSCAPQKEQSMPALNLDNFNFAPKIDSCIQNTFATSQNVLPASQTNITGNLSSIHTIQNTFATSHKVLPASQNNIAGSMSTIHNFTPALKEPESATELTEAATESESTTASAAKPASRKSKSKGAKPRSRTNKKPQYWTPEEHEKFLAGLEKFGLRDGLGPGGAELMSMWMGTRSVLQIKSHAQKFLAAERAAAV